MPPLSYRPDLCASRGRVQASGSGPLAISTQGAFLQWNRTGGDGETWLLNQKGLSNNGLDGLRFGSATQTNAVTEYARFLDNGNVGLGTTGPAYPLQVAGGAVSSGSRAFLGFPDRSASTKLYNWYATGGRATLNLTTVGVSSTDLLTVTSTGRVGIGTNSLLDLGNSSGSLPTDAATKKLAVYNNSAGTDFYGLGVSNGQLNVFAGATGPAAPATTGRTNGNTHSDACPYPKLGLLPRSDRLWRSDRLKNPRFRPHDNRSDRLWRSDRTVPATS